MASTDFRIDISAVINSKEIQEQLKSIPESDRTLDIKINILDKGNSSGETEVMKKIKESTSEYAYVLEDAVKIRDKFVNGAKVSETYKKESDEVDKLITLTKKSYTENLNYESAQKRIAKETEKTVNLNTKNAQSISALEIRIQGLTSEQKKLTNAESELQRIRQISDPKKQAEEIAGLTKNIHSATVGMQNFAASVEYSIKRFLEIGIITSAFRLIKSTISDMISTVTELDTALVELQKVTDLTGSSLDNFTSKAFEVGDAVARTGKEVIEASAIFARAGFKEDMLGLAETALVFTNVGDGIDNVEEAASTMISVLKAYKMEASDAMHVIDSLNEVSNNYAVDTDNLSMILERTSGTLAQTGTSMEELIGLATAGFETMRNAEMVASGKHFCLYVQKCA